MMVLRESTELLEVGEGPLDIEGPVADVTEPAEEGGPVETSEAKELPVGLLQEAPPWRFWLPVFAQEAPFCASVASH